MPRGPLLVVVCALVLLSTLGTGCGPFLSTYLIFSAQTELEGAQAAEAEKYAVYEYTAATAYLHKAREEQGYADYGPSIDYAFKGEEMARKAREHAQLEKKRILESPDATWEAPKAEGEQPSVIIKKKNEPAGDKVKIRVVPIPAEQPPKAP